MSIKDIKLSKGTHKEDVNKIIAGWLLLEDYVYLGVDYKHKWKCKCGNIFIRTFDRIKSENRVDCDCVKYNKQEERYKYEVEKTGEYEYIRSYRKGEILYNNKTIKEPYLKIKHLYCESEYIIKAGSFINMGNRCSKCCGTYGNSFAHHIEVELGEPLEKYWDFEKNTLNPRHISKCTNAKNSKGENLKVWIKCNKKDYHGSYEISCNSFLHGSGCSYCNPKGKKSKIHTLDSFGQYLKDNNLLHLWSDKNTVNMFDISKCNSKNVKIKCVNEELNKSNGLMKKDYHGIYETQCNSFNKGSRCSYCNPSGKIPKVHVYDSFGYHNLDKAQSWHTDNKISPFKVSLNDNRKYKFICEECGNVFEKSLNNITIKGSWCSECSASKGEKEIIRVLRLNNIKYIPQKEFDGLIGLGYGNLSYDFYLPEYNRLIEYQGDQHKRFIKVWHINQEGFDKQLEHDRRKRQYSILNGYGEVIEIWEDDYDNIEEILSREFLHIS